MKLAVIMFLITLFLIALLASTANAEFGSVHETFGSVSKTLTVIKANTTGIFPFKHSEDLAIYEIDVNVTKELRTARIDIQKTMMASDIPLPVNPRNGSVYKVFVIKTVNIPEESIKRALIKFKVPNYWLRFHAIDSETVVMSRMNKTNWTALPTIKFANDGNFTYYSTAVSNFSIFSISGRKNYYKNQSDRATNSSKTVPEETTNSSIKQIAFNDSAHELQKEDYGINVSLINPLISEYAGEIKLTRAFKYKQGENQNYSIMIGALAVILLITLLSAYSIKSSYKTKLLRIRMKWKIRRILRRLAG